MNDDTAEKHGQARVAALVEPLRPERVRFAFWLARAPALAEDARTFERQRPEVTDVDALVAQADAGPVTEFLLGHRRAGAATSIEAEGLSAVILPAPHGGMAVVGRRVADMDEVARKVFEDVAWEA